MLAFLTLCVIGLGGYIGYWAVRLKRVLQSHPAPKLASRSSGSKSTKVIRRR